MNHQLFWWTRRLQIKLDGENDAGYNGWLDEVIRATCSAEKFLGESFKLSRIRLAKQLH